MYSLTKIAFALIVLFIFSCTSEVAVDETSKYDSKESVLSQYEKFKATGKTIKIDFDGQKVLKKWLADDELMSKFNERGIFAADLQRISLLQPRSSCSYDVYCAVVLWLADANEDGMVNDIDMDAALDLIMGIWDYATAYDEGFTKLGSFGYISCWVDCLGLPLLPDPCDELDTIDLLYVLLIQLGQAQNICI